ncbi:hypothetical protein BU15DRAFT_62804 [Melanogaster broomeanus]|nr:hypothetical protein BU15DRAFT_62804 [Melanogaster broomeanus]
MDSEMQDACPASPSSSRRGCREPSRVRDGRGRHRSPSADRGSRGQKQPQSKESDHNCQCHCGWIFEPQTGVITHPSDCMHCEAYRHHYIDAAFSADTTMHDTMAQCESYWEEHILSRRVERHSSGLERHLDLLEGENQALHEDLDNADDQLTQERAWATRSDQMIESLERHVSALQDELMAHQRELTAAWQPLCERGFPSIPQWGRGRGSHPSNFANYRSQDGNGSGMSNAGAGPSNLRERSALPWEPMQTTPRGQEVKPQGKVPEARPSASGSMTMETLLCPKPTKDEPASEDYDDDASPPTTMRSVGNLVVLTIDKRDVAFSREAAKRARSAYQKGHITPISQGVRHFGDSASPLTISRQCHG